MNGYIKSYKSQDMENFPDRWKVPAGMTWKEVEEQAPELCSSLILTSQWEWDAKMVETGISLLIAQL